MPSDDAAASSPARPLRGRTVVLGTTIMLVGAAVLAAVPPMASASVESPDRRGMDHAAAVAGVDVDAAWAWLLGQLGTGTVVTTSSVLTPDRAYPPDWTDTVTGRFELVGVPAPVVAPDPSLGVDVYHGLSIQAVVVTDTAYFIATVPARADGTFVFPWSRPGTKVFRLVDERTGAVLAEHAPRTGVIRSFHVSDSSPLAGRAFAYDQALALLTADALGHRDTARDLARGLLALQTPSGPQAGGFISSAAALNPAAGLPEYRTGINALATYALLRHLQTVRPGSSHHDELADAAEAGVRWLLAQQAHGGVLTGLVTGGHGTFHDGGFDPGADVPWASTEHNIDTWHALALAALVLDDPAAAVAAHELDEAIVDLLWDDESRHFLQGRTPDGPDPTEALDVNSWGAIYLEATGRHDRAVEALAHTTLFASSTGTVSGYAPRPLGGADPLVWFEGSAGAAVGQARIGLPDDAASTVAALAPGQLPSGAFPGATRDDAYLEMTSAPAVNATTWMILGTQALAGRRSIWDDPPTQGAPRS